jgi:hypothetical protein
MIEKIVSGIILVEIVRCHLYGTDGIDIHPHVLCQVLHQSRKVGLG